MLALQAFEIARRLEDHPRIARVHYPGLPSHPDHCIAVQQMHGFGGVISFEVGAVPVALPLSACRPQCCCMPILLLLTIMCMLAFTAFCSPIGAVGKCDVSHGGLLHALGC